MMKGRIPQVWKEMKCQSNISQYQRDSDVEGCRWNIKVDTGSTEPPPFQQPQGKIRVVLLI